LRRAFETKTRARTDPQANLPVGFGNRFCGNDEMVFTELEPLFIKLTEDLPAKKSCKNHSREFPIWKPWINTVPTGLICDSECRC